MEPWHKVVTPRKEVREGRSFNPDEFATALEQVVAGTAPADYKGPEKFFSRTCFTWGEKRGHHSDFSSSERSASKLASTFSGSKTKASKNPTTSPILTSSLKKSSMTSKPPLSSSRPSPQT